MMCRFRNLLHLSLMLVTYAAGMRMSILIAALTLFGCNNDVFTRDGVTDGDTFYLAPTALTNSDAALQSWVRYSLVKSACQLQIGDDNPARASSYRCECVARRHLVDTWAEQTFADQLLKDRYLDDLRRVSDAGFLPEYTARYFSRADWKMPETLKMAEFRIWQKQHLRRHRTETRIIGSWGYGDTGTPDNAEFD